MSCLSLFGKKPVELYRLMVKYVCMFVWWYVWPNTKTQSQPTSAPTPIIGQLIDENLKKLPMVTNGIENVVAIYYSNS